jgi:hypothetical protein
MNNSENSITIDTLTGTITLTLHLKNYLTPSLNTILSSHWSNLHKHKKKAAIALASSLRDVVPNFRTLTILSAEPNLSPINSDMLDSFLTTTPPPSQQNTTNKNATASKMKKLPSESSTHPSKKTPQNPINTSPASEAS